MKKWIQRLFVVLGATAIAALTLTYWFVSRSLPQLEGTIEVAGIGANVTLVRDAAGIPTITGANRIDVAFATGFALHKTRPCLHLNSGQPW